MTLAFRRFHQELRRIASVVAVCQFALSFTRTGMKKLGSAGKINPHKPVVAGDQNDAEIARNSFHLDSKLKSQAPRYVRETAFVRLITSFEIFLVDVIRDLMFQRPDLFRSGGTIEITHAEALSVADAAYVRNKVINKELRSLHSRGFKEVAKHYEKTLSILLSDVTPDIGKIFEFHDRRHLLVHRLGAADEAYRHKYNYTVKAALTVSQSYFEDAVKTFSAFSHSLEQKVVALVASGAARQRESGIPQLDFEVEVVSPEGEAVISPSFMFLVKYRKLGEHAASLSDFLVASRDSEDGSFRQLSLEGDGEALQTYLRQLKKAHKKGAVNLLRTRANRDFKEQTGRKSTQHSLEQRLTAGDSIQNDGHGDAGVET